MIASVSFLISLFSNITPLRFHETFFNKSIKKLCITIYWNKERI